MNKMIFVFTGILIILSLSCSSREASVKTTPDTDPSTLLEKADQLYQQGNLKQARETYKTIYNSYPTSRQYIDAVLGLSRCHNDLGNYEKGMDLLYNLVSENLVPSRVPEVYNEMAKYYEVNAGISSVAGLSNEGQDFKNAVEYYRKAIHYPNSDDKQAKSYAQYRIGELYVALHKFKDATLAYRSTIQSFPNTKWAERADVRLEEMRLAVSNVLQEIRQEGVTSAEVQESGKAIQEQQEMQEDQALPVQTESEIPDTTDNKNKAIEDTTTSQVVPVDTVQTVPADTSKRPKLDLK